MEGVGGTDYMARDLSFIRKMSIRHSSFLAIEKGHKEKLILQEQ